MPFTFRAISLQAAFCVFCTHMPVPPFRVVLKTPIDSVLRPLYCSHSGLLWPLLTPARSALPRFLVQWLLLSKHSAQVSPGTTRFFLSIHLPHLSPVIPCSYWASACYAVLPSRKTLYVISVRQTGDLPVVSLFPHPASFRFLSRGHPCLRLYPSHCRADSGLSPVRNVRRQAHIKENCDASKSHAPQFSYFSFFVSYRK